MVSLVVNMSVGFSVRDYVHRCGRTGRGGTHPGNNGGGDGTDATSPARGVAGIAGAGACVAHTFVVKGDEPLCPELVAVLRASGQPVPEDLQLIARRQAAAAADKVRKADNRAKAKASAEGSAGGGGRGGRGGGAASRGWCLAEDEALNARGAEKA